MTRVKDAHNQTVVAIPCWMWIVGGLFTAVGILFVIILWRTGWDAPLGVFAATGGLLFVGIFFFVGLTSKVTFDNTLGNITIRQHIWFWLYRTRHILRKAVQHVATVTEWVSGGPSAPSIPSYDVSIALWGKGEIKIGTLTKSKAKYLADRIRAFVRFE